MAAILVEHAQYVDSAGKPLSGGSMYIGTNNANPVVTAAATIIYSDRALTVPISNPQPIDSDGRATNKVWVRGRYSIQVNNSSGVQSFQDLDAGSRGTVDNTSIFVLSVIGNDAIAGVTAEPISEYLANQQFVFKTVGENTGEVTLNIDGVGARPVIKYHSSPMAAGDFMAQQVVVVAYNTFAGSFEVINRRTRLVDFYQGDDVASAIDLPLIRDGNDVNITGTTTIESIDLAADSIGIGAVYRLKFTDALMLRHHATKLNLLGGLDVTVSAGDSAEFHKDALGQWSMVSISAISTMSEWQDGFSTKPSLISPALLRGVFRTATLTGAITSSGSLAYGSFGSLFQVLGWRATLTCLTAEHGYIAGDTVEALINSTDQGTHINTVWIKNSNNFGISYCNDPRCFTTASKLGGVRRLLTNANWEISITIWGV